MPRFYVDVKVTGYEEVVVEADNEEEAQDKAVQRVAEIYSKAPGMDLRWKKMICTIKDEE